MTDRRFVVGVDGSAVAQEALSWTARLAAALGGEIVVVHAIGLLEESLHTKVAEIVEQTWCASLRGGPAPFRVVARNGLPAEVLVDVACEADTALLVVGSRGDGGQPALSLGSTSLHVLQMAPCPVLVVPAREDARRHLGLLRLLVAVDGTPDCEPAVGWACELAAAFGSRIEIVHAVEDVDVFPLGPATAVSSAGEWEAPAVAAALVDPLRRQVGALGIPVHVRIERGAPQDVVPDAAAAIDADLVVLASRHVGDPEQALLAGVSRQVARIMHRPTLVLPIRAPVAV